MKKITLLLILSFLTVNTFAQFSQNFENGWTAFTTGAGTQGPGGPTGWYIRNITGALTWAVNSPAAVYPAHGGTVAAFMNRQTMPAGQLAEDWLVTPQVTIPANPELDFWSRLNVTGNQGSLYYVYMNDKPGSTQTTWADYTMIADWTETTINTVQNQWSEKKVSINTTATTAYFAFVMKNNAGDVWVIDDVNIWSKCVAPSTLTASNFTTSSADLSWANPSGATSWEIETVYGSGNPTGVGTVYNGSLPYHATQMSDGTPFTPDTQYRYYVRSLCSASNKSTWGGPFGFATLGYGDTCAEPLQIPPALPYITGNSTAAFGNMLEGTPGTGCGVTGNYLAGNDAIYKYTADFTGTINLGLHTTSPYSSFFVYGSCAAIGTNCLAGGTGSIISIPNFPVTSGQSYYIVVSSLQGTQSISYILDINKEQCTSNIAATFSLNCTQGASIFNPIANITSLGSATQLTVTPYFGYAGQGPQNITSTGAVNLGNFVSAVSSMVVLQSVQNPNCYIISPPLNQGMCTPLNDDCANATILTPNTTGTGDYFATGNLYSATPSSQSNDCPANDEDDVWFKFTAVGETHYINIISTFNISHAVYEGNCGAFTQLYCSNSNQSIATNLIPGQVYYVRVYSTGTSQVTDPFEIITTGIADNCTDTNSLSANVQTLFKNLLNHLLSVSSTLSPSVPYECAELTALAPYITDPNPKIYIQNISSTALQFNFGSHANTDLYPDVYIVFSSASGGTQYISALDFYTYTDPETRAPIHILLGNNAFVDTSGGKPNSVKHINFCPDPTTNPGGGTTGGPGDSGSTTPVYNPDPTGNNPENPNPGNPNNPGNGTDPTGTGNNGNGNGNGTGNGGSTDNGGGTNTGGNGTTQTGTNPGTGDPCTVTGYIDMEPGESCIVTGTPTGFTFHTGTPAPGIQDYTWVFYDGNMSVAGTSHLATPVMTFNSQDTYIVKLTITTTAGCVVTFQRTFSVLTSCTGYCTNTNPQSAVVKQLYINLINHLLSIYPEGTVPNGYNCPQLIALAPYITDANPRIYDLNYTGGILRFSFVSAEGAFDVIVKDNGPVMDFDILNFTSASTVTTATQTIHNNGTYSNGHTIRHINFCPNTTPCPPLTGTINLNTGLTCVPVGSAVGLNFQSNGANATQYAWTFYATNGTTVLSSVTSPYPNATITYAAAGTYPVKLVVTYGSSCTATFNKTVVASATCGTACTETNPQSGTVKQLYLNLVNHLLGIYISGNTVSNPYTCPQLTALAPYITDNNVKIWNVSYTGQILKFSFNNHGTDYDVAVPATTFLADINLIPFTSATTAQTFTSYYGTGVAVANHSIRHVNFCPSTECVPLYGDITLGSGMQCVVVNTQQSFTIPVNTINIASYQWTFYDLNGYTPWFVSSSANPVMSYTAPGNYLIKVIVTENSGCSTTFYKTITVSTSCSSSCTETNEQSEVVKELYITLLNHLLGLSAAPANGYTCPELSALAPYMNNTNPAIYNASYNGNVLSFSFSSGSSSDVTVTKNGTISDVNIFPFNPSLVSQQQCFTVTYTNGTQNTHCVKTINFCPPEIPCQSHVAFVIDESGSISATEAEKIKAQLYAFIDQQEGSNMTVSFTGMSDSDMNTRNDHVYGKITAANKQDFENWITRYKSTYTTQRRNAGISPNSDYWTSGLSKALMGYDLKPEIIIVITDGSQTADVNGFKNLIAQIKNDPETHLYVYGVGSGYYVDGTPSNGDPNSNTTNPISEVSLKLMTSLKFLMQLSPTQFPAYSQNELLDADYYEYPDFTHLSDDLRYFSDKLAAADIGCGGEPIPKDFCNDCQTFQPTPKATYWISAWVKEEQNVQVKTYTNGVLRLIFEDGDEYQLGESEFFPSGEIIDGWQRIAAKFEVPESTSIMKVELENISPNIPVYFDDIRVHPISGSMKSFVYDPVTFRLMAELDDNNYSTFYEYDNEGGLVRIKKETSEGIKTIQESRSGNVIKTAN